MGCLRHPKAVENFPPNARSTRKTRAGGTVVVLPSFPKHLDKPAFLTGGLWFVVAATTKPCNRSIILPIHIPGFTLSATGFGRSISFSSHGRGDPCGVFAYRFGVRSGIVGVFRSVARSGTRRGVFRGARPIMFRQ